MQGRIWTENEDGLAGAVMVIKGIQVCLEKFRTQSV